jgi:hypothetical protein
MFSSFHLHRTVYCHLVQGRTRHQENESEILYAVDHKAWLIPAEVFQSFIECVGRDPCGVRFAQVSRSGSSDSTMRGDFSRNSNSNASHPPCLPTSKRLAACFFCSCPWCPLLTSGCRIVEKPDARGKTLFDPFLLPVTDQEVNVIGIAEILLFHLPLTLEESGIRMLARYEPFSSI